MFVTSRTCSSVMHVVTGDRKQCLFIESYIRKKYHIQKNTSKITRKKINGELIFYEYSFFFPSNKKKSRRVLTVILKLGHSIYFSWLGCSTRKRNRLRVLLHFSKLFGQLLLCRDQTACLSLM